MPEGTFTYDAKDQSGEWVILPVTSNESIYKLQGNINLKEAIVDVSQISLIAEVNLKLNNFLISGSSLDSIRCSLNGTNKDDPSVFRGVKTTTLVRGLEYRF